MIYGGVITTISSEEASATQADMGRYTVSGNDHLRFIEILHLCNTSMIAKMRVLLAVVRQVILILVIPFISELPRLRAAPGPSMPI